MMMGLEALIMRGLPGSGKSTWAKNYCYAAPLDHSVITLSTDDLFMVEGKYVFDRGKLGTYHNHTLTRFINLLYTRSVDTVIVDNTNLSTWEIAPYYRIAEALGYTPTIVHMTTPVDVCIARRTNTEKSVPEDTIRRMAGSLGELPRWWKVVTVTGD